MLGVILTATLVIVAGVAIVHRYSSLPLEKKYESSGGGLGGAFDAVQPCPVAPSAGVTHGRLAGAKPTGCDTSQIAGATDGHVRRRKAAGCDTCQDLSSSTYDEGPVLRGVRGLRGDGPQLEEPPKPLKRWLNFSTRPAESMMRCLPV